MIFEFKEALILILLLFKRSLFNAAYVKLKKNKLYHETSFYSSENLNVNEKINYGSKPLMATGTLDNFFHASAYNLCYVVFVVTGRFPHKDI